MVVARPGSSPSSNARLSGTTLALRDARGRETGSLVVKLLDPAMPRTDRALAIDSNSDNVGPGQDIPPPAPEPAHGAAEDSGVVEDSGDNITNLLRRVVDKTKTVADSVKKTAEVCVSLLS